jgi:hypothetical protein
MRHVGRLVVAALSSAALAACAGAAAKLDDPASKVAYSVNNLRMAVDMFVLVERRLPTSLVELTRPSARSGEPMMRSVPTDPWGTDFQYRPSNPERYEYELRSAGEDRAFDTPDDVVVKARAGG